MRPTRVTIVHPPLSVSRDFIDYPYFANLGAIQAMAVLREEAMCDARLVDAFSLPGASLQWRPDGRAHLGTEVEHLIKSATEAPADLFVVAYTPFHRPPTRDDLLAQTLDGLRRASPTSVILLADLYQSGQHYVESPGAQVLGAYPEADAWLKYESEHSLPEIVRTLARTGERPAGALIATRPPNLDLLPTPAWDDIDLDAYDAFRADVVTKLGRSRWSFPIDGRTIPMITSRGCPFTCTHCSSNPDLRSGETKGQRRYSAGVLRAHLGRLKGDLGATRVAVLDELINVNAAHFDTFLEEVERLDLAFEVPNGLRADYLNPTHFTRMRDLVTTVSVSAESGSQDVLDRIVTKRLDLGAIRAAAENAAYAEVPLMIHYIIGLPGEEPLDVQATLELATSLWEEHRAWPAVQFATPLPGTGLAAEPSVDKVQLETIEDWGPHFQKAAFPLNSTIPPTQLEVFSKRFYERVRAQHEALQVEWALTYACNDHCAFCARGPRSGQVQAPELADAELPRVTPGEARLTISGGEPTTHPEVIKALRMARDLGYDEIALSTNGRMLSYGDFTRQLVQAGVSSFHVSIHGATAETHDAVVGVAGAYAQMLSGIENVKRLNAEVTLQLNTSLLHHNACELDGIAQIAVDHHAHTWRLQAVRSEGGFCDGLGLELEQIRARVTELIRIWGTRVAIEVENVPPCELPEFTEHIIHDGAALAGRVVYHSAVDLGYPTYTGEGRHLDARCPGCPHLPICAGHYLPSRQGPPWLKLVPHPLVTGDRIGEIR